MATAYLDNSATTRPCDEAIEAMVRCMREHYYNPSSVYAPAVEEFRAVRECRDLLLRSVNARAHDLIFTSGGTEANNLAILGAVHRMRGPQVLAVSAVEHPSVREAFEELAREGHDVRVIGVDEHGVLNWEQLAAALDGGASLVSCMQVNNETGALLDTKRLRRLTAGRALIHVDGVQGYLRVPFDMDDADLYTLSGHKIHGPKGIGALIVRRGVRLAPRQIGGGQEQGLRSGTENTPGIAGLHAAAKRLLDAGAGARAALMERKLYMASRFLEAVPEALVNGPSPVDGAPHILNLSFPGVRGEVMLHALEAEGIYASTGSACSSKKRKVSAVLTAMGISPERAEWALRFSISPLTTDEEIDYAAGRLAGIYDMLKRYKRR